MSAGALPLRRGRARSLFPAAKRDPILTICLLVLAAFVAIAVLAPVVAPYGPNTLDLNAVSVGPSANHLLGTDALGRDLLSRVIWGARTSLLGPLLVIALSTLLATVMALAAAWIGGWFDSSMSAGLDVIFAFPGMLLAIVAVALFGTGLIAPVIALSIAYTPYVARVLRGAALRERSLPYVEALTVQGFSGWRITLRHVLVGLIPLVLVQATLSFAYATIDLAGISYLGLGVQPPTADWGLMVAQGQPSILAGHPAEAIYPGVALIVVVVAVTLIGRRLAHRWAQA
jgi:peptide/nickel transport system permease protein